MWTANCEVCGILRRGTNGLFCANFGLHRGPPFDVCKRAWCGSCYTQHPLDTFRVFVPTVESGFEWRKHPADALKYKAAQNGDHLVTPFQCHFCLFRLLTRRVHNPGNPKDEWLLCCLVRANLDAFWGRAPSTVVANRRNLDQLMKMWSEVGLAPDLLLPALGPYPDTDVQGVSVAVAMLVKSTKPGRHNREYTQFETLRKLRAAYSNMFHASARSNIDTLTLGRDMAKSFLTTCPTQSSWFERFCSGCVQRMGQEVKQDLAVSIQVILAFQEEMEKEWREPQTLKQRIQLAMIGAYPLIAFGGSFRGHEVFLVDTFGIIKYAKKKLVERGQAFAMVPLLGRYKTENADRYHLTPLALRSVSGLEFGRWVARLADAKKAQGLSHGPAFSDEKGNPVDPRWLEMEILDRFKVVQEKYTDIIRPDVQVYEEFGISRSFRRGATTEARNQKVSENDINLMNRWRNFEKAGGKRPRMRMQDHYSDIALMIPSLLRFSQAL